MLIKVKPKVAVSFFVGRFVCSAVQLQMFGGLLHCSKPPKLNVLHCIQFYAFTNRSDS